MRNQIRTILLLGVLSAVLVGIGAMLGEGMMVVALAFTVLMNLGAYFYSDKIVLKMSRAQEVSPAEAPALHRMVEDIAARAGIPKPRVYLIPEDQPNAFATGRSPKHGVVAVTSGILRILDERELRGVIAHEIGHIKNRDILVASIAAMMAGAVGYLAHMLAFAGLFGRSNDEEGSPAGGFLAVLIAPIAATLIQLGISRSREYLADETGARLSGDPEALARALEKLHLVSQRVPAHVNPATASLYIVSPLAGGRSLANLFSTHPSMEERVKRLRRMACGPAFRAA